ncbi:MAG: hypothetical protein U9R08_07120 [Nanoarchaeota archaeon]|nr:hypothetical protein [Nanoarchaeota archaeon]
MKDKILAYINSKGPVLPRNISKEFKLSLTFAGAYLSELISNKKLFFSNAKIGGSPIYFLDSQRDKLENELYKYLNEKDRSAVDIIKKEKILRDKEQSPLIQIALRNIKDFAIALTVNLKTGKELYWKWHLISNEEVETIIKSKFIDSKKDFKPIKESLATTPIETKESLESKKPIETSNIEKINIDNSDIKNPKLKSEIEEPQNILKSDKPLKVITTSTPTTKHIEKTKTIEKVKKSEPTITKTKIITQEKLKSPKNSEKISKIDNSSDENDSFLIEVNNYLTSRNICIKAHEIIKKKSDIDLIINIPTPIGPLDFFCKARNKKRCNEADLSTAFVKGALKKLPILFLTTGSLTKKAKETLKTDFKNIIINTIGGA